MSFTTPYRQHHYIGEHADDNSADTFITSSGFTKGVGLLYFNTADARFRFWDGSTWLDIQIGFTKRLGWTVEPKTNGAIRWLGWYIQTDAALNVTSAVPQSVSVPGYHSHVVMNVTASAGVPFTARLTGTSVDEATGALTPADTEDITVTGNGYYQSTKSWITAVQISIVEAAKSMTLDAYRTTYWDNNNNDFTVVGLRFEWTPDAAVWSIQLQIDRVNNDGSLTNIYNQTFTNGGAPPRAAQNQPGKDKRTSLTFLCQSTTLHEGIVVYMNQTSIRTSYVEVVYQ